MKKESPFDVRGAKGRYGKGKGKWLNPKSHPAKKCINCFKVILTANKSGYCANCLNLISHTRYRTKRKVLDLIENTTYDKTARDVLIELKQKVVKMK